MKGFSYLSLSFPGFNYKQFQTNNFGFEGTYHVTPNNFDNWFCHMEKGIILTNSWKFGAFSDISFVGLREHGNVCFDSFVFCITFITQSYFNIVLVHMLDGCHDAQSIGDTNSSDNMLFSQNELIGGYCYCSAVTVVPLLCCVVALFFNNRVICNQRWSVVSTWTSTIIGCLLSSSTIHFIFKGFGLL